MLIHVLLPCSVTLGVKVAMNWGLWNATSLSFSSGYSYDTQSACEAAAGSGEKTLSCVQLVLNLKPIEMPAPSRRRRLTYRELQTMASASPSPSPNSDFSAQVVLVVPESLTSQYTLPGTYFALRNTDLSATSTGACATGSTAADYANGVITANLCSAGSYSLKVVGPADNAAGAASGGKSGLSSGGTAGVVIGALAFVAAGVAVGKSLRRKSSTNVKEIAASRDRDNNAARSRVVPNINTTTGSPRQRRNRKGDVEVDSPLADPSPRARTPRGSNSQFSRKADEDRAPSPSMKQRVKMAGGGGGGADNVLEQLAAGVDPRAVSTIAPESNLLKLAVQGPITGGSRGAMNQAPAPSASLLDLALRGAPGTPGGTGTGMSASIGVSKKLAVHQIQVRQTSSAAGVRTTTWDPALARPATSEQAPTPDSGAK